MDSLLGEKVRAFLVGLLIAIEVSWIADALRRRDYAALTVALAVAFVAISMAIAALSRKTMGRRRLWPRHRQS